MTEEDEIMAARRYSPAAVRALAQIARTTADISEHRDALKQLVARRFVSTSDPSDADLERVEGMSDAEIFEHLRKQMD